jgi:hypothetical protein
VRFFGFLGIEGLAIGFGFSRHCESKLAIAQGVNLEIANGSIKEPSIMLTRSRCKLFVEEVCASQQDAHLFSKLLASPATTLVVPSSFDFKANTVSSSSHVGSLKDLSSVTRLVC